MDTTLLVIAYGFELGWENPEMVFPNSRSRAIDAEKKRTGNRYLQ